MAVRFGGEQIDQDHGIQVDAVPDGCHEYFQPSTSGNHNRQLSEFQLNSTTPFGSIQAKGTQRRQFKAQLRLNF
jgi:hypothetical protein